MLFEENDFFIYCFLVTFRARTNVASTGLLYTQYHEIRGVIMLRNTITHEKNDLIRYINHRVGGM